MNINKSPLSNEISRILTDHLPKPICPNRAKSYQKKRNEFGSMTARKKVQSVDVMPQKAIKHHEKAIQSHANLEKATHGREKREKNIK